MNVTWPWLALAAAGAFHGLNPYSVPPSALGSGPLLASIASVWRPTASPYGPLFVTVSRAAAAIPSARFQLLADTGHVPQIETPRQLLEAIWDFASAHATKRSAG